MSWSARAAALDRCRVDQPGVVGPHVGVLGEQPDHRLQLHGRAAQPLVVAGLTRQVREQMGQMAAGVAQPAGLVARTPTAPASPPTSTARRRTASVRSRPSGATAAAPDDPSSVSSIRTYSAVARVSRSASIRSSKIEFGLATPIMDAPITSDADPHPLELVIWRVAVADPTTAASSRGRGRRRSVMGVVECREQRTGVAGAVDGGLGWRSSC